MSNAPSASRPATPAIHAQRRRSNRKLWLIPGLVLIGVPAFYIIVFTIYWPFKTEALIDVLQERSRRSVTIDHFRTTYFPPGGVAEGIKFWCYKHKSQSPLITIQEMKISVTFPTLLTFQRHLDYVRVTGLHLVVPAHQPTGDPSPMRLLTTTSSKLSLPVRHLEVNDALLDYFIGSSSQPLRVTVAKLLVSNVSSKTAMPYSIELSNSEVPGSIKSNGTFGPVDLKQSADTPIHGLFSYEHGILTPVPAITGTLFTSGNYNGRLGDISVNGTAHVRNFAIKDTSHVRDVAADYNLAVNATNGNIELKVDTAFDQSDVLFTGSVSGNGNHGQIASIDLSSRHARVQDLLDLFISEQPPMAGNATFTGHFSLPAGFHSFLRDMTLTGSFGIAQGKFTKASTEESLTKLSLTSKAVKREERQPDPGTVLSDLTGSANVKQAIARLSHVEFRIPGARARLAGTYSLLTYQANLAGTLVTTGNVSDTQTGIKSLYLKVLTPFLKKHRAAKIVPFKITGPYGHMNVSLDLGHKARKISS